MLLAPWDYLFESFNPHAFPDLYTPTWIAALGLLVGLIVLYNLRTRALHRHPPFLDLYEWLLWAGLSVFGLILTAALFNFDLIVLLVVMVVGFGVMIWIRFIRFPPILEAYEVKLAKQRYFSRTKYAHPEATIRPKSARPAKPARRGSRKRR